MYVEDIQIDSHHSGLIPIFADCDSIYKKGITFFNAISHLA